MWEFLWASDVGFYIVLLNIGICVVWGGCLDFGFWVLLECLGYLIVTRFGFLCLMLQIDGLGFNSWLLWVGLGVFTGWWRRCRGFWNNVGLYVYGKLLGLPACYY